MAPIPQIKPATYFAFALLVYATVQLSVLPCMAQQASPGNMSNLNQRQTREHLAIQQVKHLGSGVLLVRLHRRNTVIAPLQAKGLDAEAQRIETEQRELNESIINAFKNEWDFTPVYFFYSDQSNAVLNRDWENVTLMDSTMSQVHPFEAGARNFLIAEFGSLQQEAGEHFELHYVNEEGEWKKEAYGHPGAANYGLTGLHIMSNRFDAVSKPFPAYVRTFNPLPFRRNPAKAVKLLNKKMHAFSASHNLP
jgi:hypothetical protein